MGVGDHVMGLGAADWHECLYTFHASRGDWRKAALAMHTVGWWLGGWVGGWVGVYSIYNYE